jgi:nitrite reductase/ring-hydroxylating ferredoxin subunit
VKQALIKVADVPATGAAPIDFFGRPALAYRSDDGTVRATLAICPHLGGPLEWKGGELVCAWHGQRHDAVSGRCLGGPAPTQQAMRIPTRIEGDTLHYVWGE